MNLLNKLERKYGKYGVTNLIVGIILINIFVYVINTYGRIDITDVLIFNREKILKGEVWRLITFIFAEKNSGIISFALGCYFTYMSGSYLEMEWGSFKFTFYYLVGIITSIIIGFITGYELNGYYINLSLFLAFAKLFPNYQLLLMYIIPVKVKYIGLVNWIIILLNIIGSSSLMEVLVRIIPLINYFIFFGKSKAEDIKFETKHGFRKREFKRKIKSATFRQQCEVCKITDLDDKDMEFRYCSKCSEPKCYCINHIKNHEHK